MTDQEAAALGAAALAEVEPGHVVGLGTGQAATAFILALGKAVKEGLRVTGVATSEASASLARRLGIPLIDEPVALDVAVDGADEVDPRLDLIKGYGGALVREKIVAAAARRFIVLVGGEKLVPALGARGRLPVEVVPFAAPFCRRRLTELGYPPTLRLQGGTAVVTDNANLILDAAVTSIPDAAGLDRALREIPGVVGTGLFVNMAHHVLVWEDGAARTLTSGKGLPSRGGAP
ncbi:MAG TPA: ribose-5-phosphate isomerase RpiA [Methylomirabilota bacterium]|nr:ribose-5-phosphate isomerase RpiA [Methylomirabilota bacterium]